MHFAMASCCIVSQTEILSPTANCYGVTWNILQDHPLYRYCQREVGENGNEMNKKKWELGTLMQVSEYYRKVDELRSSSLAHVVDYYTVSK